MSYSIILFMNFFKLLEHSKYLMILGGGQNLDQIGSNRCFKHEFKNWMCKKFFKLKIAKN